MPPRAVPCAPRPTAALGAVEPLAPSLAEPSLPCSGGSAAEGRSSLGQVVPLQGAGKADDTQKLSGFMLNK